MAKELLEGMNRIEAPIFIDETFLNFFLNKGLEKISFSRLINSNWSTKNETVLGITLKFMQNYKRFIKNLIILRDQFF